MKENTTSTQAASKAPRPFYMKNIYGFGGSTGKKERCHYSKKEENHDVKLIEKARQNLEDGFNNSLSVFWWLKRTPRLSEISYTLEEAIRLQGWYYLSSIINESISSTDPDPTPSYHLGYIGMKIKSGKVVHLKGEERNKKMNDWYEQPVDKDVPKKPTSDDFTKAGITDLVCQEILFKRTESILLLLLSRIRESKTDHQYLYNQIEKCLRYFPSLKDKHEIKKYQLLELVSEGRIVEAQLHAENFRIQDKNSLDNLERALSLKTKLGLTFEDVGLNEEEVIKYLGETRLEEILKKLMS